MGRRAAHSLPGGQSEGFAYDFGGNVAYATNFNGVVITNQFDELNRLTNKSSVFGYKVSFAYSPTGQRTNMVDPSGSTAYFYDNRDRLVAKTNLPTSGPTLALNYSYDVNGNLTNLWSGSPGGVNLVYQYDLLNRLTNVLANGSLAASYTFDLVGNVQTLHYGNGVTNLYQYDVLNRLTNAFWKLNTTTNASFYYQLGLTGNRTNLSETVNGTSRTYAWSYDWLYRMTNENISGLGNAGYAYDPVGNRTNRTVSGGLSLANQTPTYTTNDWLTTDAYDNNGNTLWSTNGSVAGPYYYDAENRLTNFNNAVLLAYNGDGIRMTKAAGGTTNYYLVDDRNPSGYAQVLEEWTSTGTPSLSKVYNYGLALVSQKQGSTTYYFIPDGHGSTRVLTDGSGTVQNAFAYDAFGTLIASNTTAQTAYLYCGEQLDSNLGFYYLRARYLNPNTGRFWTRDTFEGFQEDPLSLHKYLYAQDDPVMGIDPTGHDFNLVSLTVGNAIRGGIAGMTLGAINAGFTYAKTRSFSAAALSGTQTASMVFVSFLSAPFAVAATVTGASSIYAGIEDGSITYKNSPEFASYAVAAGLLAVVFHTTAFGEFTGTASGELASTTVPLKSISRVQAVMNKANQWDWSTPRDSAAFYSRFVQNYPAARASGKVLIEDTAGGKALVADSEFQSLTKEEQIAVWYYCSMRYAQAATGRVAVYAQNASGNSIFKITEEPILRAGQKNGTITGINYFNTQFP